jgi:hypothetical protein
LKIRTGWNRANRNGVAIAKTGGERSGIAALAVHGRTRADLYQGEAEYDTIRRDQVRRSENSGVWPMATSTRREKAARGARGDRLPTRC